MNCIEKLFDEFVEYFKIFDRLIQAEAEKNTLPFVLRSSSSPKVVWQFIVFIVEYLVRNSLPDDNIIVTTTSEEKLTKGDGHATRFKCRMDKQQMDYSKQNSN